LHRGSWPISPPQRPDHPAGEDPEHVTFTKKLLQTLGRQLRDFRFERSPSSRESAERFVREHSIVPQMCDGCGVEPRIGRAIRAGAFPDRTPGSAIQARREGVPGHHDRRRRQERCRSPSLAQRRLRLDRADPAAHAVRALWITEATEPPAPRSCRPGGTWASSQPISLGLDPLSWYGSVAVSVGSTSRTGVLT